MKAYYDLSVSPPTYDIVAFLMAIERWRIKMGHDKIVIDFLPGPAGGFRSDRFWPHNVAERQRMLHQVAIPMARLLPSAAQVVMANRPPRWETGSIGFTQHLYGLKLFTACIGEGIRPLQAPEDRREPGLVTITLREAEHWPQRNSDVPEWVAAAKAIKAKGHHVVVVRDTLRADESLDGIETHRSASLDLYERANLYRSADCNMFVNNGPAWFAMALDVPVLILKPNVERVTGTCSAAYFRSCGVQVGQSIPGAPDYQRIIWTDDTEQSILASFDAFINHKEIAYA